MRRGAIGAQRVRGATGALTLSFCPGLNLEKPLCKGSGVEFSRGAAGRGVNFLPIKNLGDEAVQLAVQEAPDRAKAEYIVVRRGALVAAVGDEELVLDPGTPSEKLAPVSLDFMYKFLPPTARIRPYLLAGSGLMPDRRAISPTAFTNRPDKKGCPKKYYICVTVGPGSGNRHFIASTAVELDLEHNAAQATSYYLYVSANDGQHVIRASGIYQDSFRQTESGWLFAERVALR